MRVHAALAAALTLLTILMFATTTSNPVDCTTVNFNDDKSGLQCTITATKTIVKWHTLDVYNALFDSAGYEKATSDKCPDLGPQHGKRAPGAQDEPAARVSDTPAERAKRALERRKLDTAFLNHNWKPGYYVVKADVTATVANVKYITNAIGTAKVVNSTNANIIPCGLAVNDDRLTDCHCYGPAATY